LKRNSVQVIVESGGEENESNLNDAVRNRDLDESDLNNEKNESYLDDAVSNRDLDKGDLNDEEKLERPG
jgi:hypothetical protein